MDWARSKLWGRRQQSPGVIFHEHRGGISRERLSRTTGREETSWVGEISTSTSRWPQPPARPSGTVPGELIDEPLALAAFAVLLSHLWFCPVFPGLAKVLLMRVQTHEVATPALSTAACPQLAARCLLQTRLPRALSFYLWAFWGCLGWTRGPNARWVGASCSRRLNQARQKSDGLREIQYALKAATCATRVQRREFCWRGQKDLRRLPGGGSAATDQLKEEAGRVLTGEVVRSRGRSTRLRHLRLRMGLPPSRATPRRLWTSKSIRYCRYYLGSSLLPRCPPAYVCQGQYPGQKCCPVALHP